jgi:ribosome modulation factor
MEPIKAKVVLDAGAYNEGYRAGAEGRPSDNPYQVNDDRGLAWISGYIEGQARPGTQTPEKPR